jgi:hypothetical protein
MSAKLLGGELEKVLLPFASALFDLKTDVAALKAQPVGGGPALRRVEKTLGNAPASQQQQTPAKPQMTAFTKQMLADLQQKAHTDSSPSRRADYQRQYKELAAQYE